MENKRVEFVPRHECDHGGLVKGDRCYGCGTIAHLCEEDIEERKHRQKMKHEKELPTKIPDDLVARLEEVVRYNKLSTRDELTLKASIEFFKYFQILKG